MKETSRYVWNIVRSLAVRIIYVVQIIFFSYIVVLFKAQPLYWLISLAAFFIFVECIYLLIKRQGIEYIWVYIPTLVYIVAMNIPIWFLVWAKFALDDHRCAKVLPMNSTLSTNNTEQLLNFTYNNEFQFFVCIYSKFS